MALEGSSASETEADDRNRECHRWRRTRIHLYNERLYNERLAVSTSAELYNERLAVSTSAELRGE